MPLFNRLNAWAQAEGQVAGFALFRIIVGLMSVRYLMTYIRGWSAEGFYGNYFFNPYTTLIPQPNEAVYLMVLGIGLLSAAALVVGYRSRAAALICFLAIAYHFSLNEIWHRHNRYFLILSLFLLCFSPAGRALSIDATRLKLAPIGPLWSGFLIKAQMTLIYLASATSKSLDPAWRGGATLTGRSLGQLWSEWMPGFVITLIPPDLGVRLLTIQALLSEYFLAIFLWFPRTRRFAIWWGIIFHGFIEVRYSVLTFTYLTLATYFIFANLRFGEKVWIYPSGSVIGRLAARVVPWLDWLFQIRLAAHSGRGHQFIARDGTVYHGLTAWVMLGASFPILYLFFYPLTCIRYLPWGRGREAFASSPVEAPGRPLWWLVLSLAAYLVFVVSVNLDWSLKVPAELRRFWDLPWFFGLMSLIAAIYHRTMARPGPVPVTKPAEAVEAPAVLGTLKATT